MDKGFYVIFEGSDGAGKTTVMHQVAESFTKRLDEKGVEHDRIILTHHPGSTSLGQHIRQLVKFPRTFDKNIQVDELSRQMLYMVDTINFVRTLLEPALNRNKIVFADRSSYISALVYGRADGLDLRDIEKVFDILIPPKADRLMVLQLPATICMERMRENREEAETDELDHYDHQPIEFFEKITNLYDNLITTSPEQTALVSRSVPIDDVISVDATLPLHQVVDIITNDLEQIFMKRCV